MTTATDTGWKATDAQTGADLTVQEVKAAVARASRNDRTERERELEEQLDRLAHENTQLRKQLGGWTPTRDWRTITSAADLTERQRNAAMVAPTVEQLRAPDENGRPGAFIAAEMVAGVDRKPGWPVWLDELHHLHKVDKERWAGLHAMLAESETRTGTPEPSPEPVEWPWAEYHEQPALPVSAEGQAFLAQGPAADDSMAGVEAGPPHRLPPPPPPDAARRRKTLAQAAHGERRELQPATEDPPRRTGWKRTTWLTRMFDAIFPLKPANGAKDEGA